MDIAIEGHTYLEDPSQTGFYTLIERGKDGVDLSNYLLVDQFDDLPPITPYSILLDGIHQKSLKSYFVEGLFLLCLTDLADKNAPEFIAFANYVWQNMQKDIQEMSSLMSNSPFDFQSFFELYSRDSEEYKYLRRYLIDYFVVGFIPLADFYFRFKNERRSRRRDSN